MAGRQLRDPDGPGAQGQDRPQAVRTGNERAPAGFGPPVQLVRDDAVRHQARPHGVIPRHRADEDRRARGKVATGRVDPGRRQRGQGRLESADLAGGDLHDLRLLEVAADAAQACSSGTHGLGAGCDRRAHTAPEARLDLQLDLQVRRHPPPRPR
jgi:hypothetical protein